MTDRPPNYEAIDYGAIDEHLARIQKDTRIELVEPAPAFGAFFRAAAVLSTFDETLKPVPPGDGGTFDDLLDHATTVRDQERNTRYVLDADVRRRVLLSLEHVDAINAARAANPDAPVDDVQQVFDACVRGAVPSLDGAGETQLAALFEVSAWLEGIVPGIPERAAIHAALDRVYLLRPFNDLVGQRFAGRTEELRQLRAYVGVLPTGSAWSWLANRAADILDWHKKPPLSIYGPGGIGKSTLVAKFILDHATIEEAKRFPFIYLDFDRPDLLAVEPLTILLEAVRQIGIQWPALRKDCEQLRQKWSQDIVRQQGIASSANAAVQARTGRVSAVAERRPFVRDFARLLSRAQLQNRPILLVLDTFEEVQSRSDAAVQGMYKFLAELQHEVPRLRTVFSGRAPLKEVATEPLPVLQLDPAAAASILRRSGMPAATAEKTASWIGGHPLLLWLAAELLRRLQEEHGVERGIEVFEAETTKAQIAEGGVQGFLYSRILEHIKDDRVKDLAHPGMVLRRITPEIILEVAAGPCGVEVADLDDALKILRVMETEVALVLASGEREVRHRPDIRKLMLKVAAHHAEYAKPIEEIHHNAITFYTKEYERTHRASDRAEELYHRLMLNQPATELDGRWIDDVRPLLFSAVDELEPTARAWLSVRLSLELDDDARTQSSSELWEWDAVRRATELLAVNEPARALDVIRERDFRSDGSPLMLLEGQALERAGDPSAALDTLHAAIDQTFRTGADAARTDLLLALADIYRRLERFDEALRSVDTAQLVAERRRDVPAQVRAAAVRLQLRQHEHLRPGAAAVPTREALSRLLADLTDPAMLLVQDAVREVAGAIGAEDLPALRRVLQTIGLGVPDVRRLNALAAALEEWDQAVATSTGDARLRRVNMIALRKALAEVCPLDELRKMADEALGARGERNTRSARRAGVTPEELALTITTAYDAQGRIEALVERVTAAAPSAAANLRKSTGPIARMFNLEYSPEGTLASLLINAITAVALALDRALGEYPPPREVLDAICAALRTQATTVSGPQASAAHGLQLMPEQRPQAAAALVEQLGTYSQLASVLKIGLNVSLESIASPSQPIVVVATQVVEWVEREGQLLRLLVLAVQAGQNYGALLHLLTDLGVISQAARDAWPRVRELDARVCRVQVSDGEIASGMLIGRDVVLTARSAVRSGPGKVEGACLFDHQLAFGVIEPGVTVAVVEVVHVDDGAEIAVLRLARPIGLEPAGGLLALPNPLPRRWERLTAPLPDQGGSTPSVMLYRTAEGSSRLSYVTGVTVRTDTGDFEYRVATETSAIGAPLLTPDLRVVGIHQGRGSWFKFNVKRGTLISRVVESLRDQPWMIEETGYSNAR